MFMLTGMVTEIRKGSRPHLYIEEHMRARDMSDTKSPWPPRCGKGNGSLMTFTLRRLVVVTSRINPPIRNMQWRATLGGDPPGRSAIRTRRQPNPKRCVSV